MAKYRAIDYTRLDEARKAFAEVLRLSGLREAEYRSQLGELADLATQRMIASGSQFLFDYGEYGSGALAERYDVTDRTIRNWRREELESGVPKIGNKQAA